jgi:DNA modification methylase
MSDLLTVLCGDALEKLRELPDESVQCCVTSPPYWGLRDYGFCGCRKHRVQHESSTLAGTQAGTPNHVGPPRSDCPICNGSGRIAGMGEQVGLEKTPEEYVSKMVAVFREIRRVLKRDGTLWLNLGDSYAGSGRGMNGDGSSGKINSAKQQSNSGANLDFHDRIVDAGGIGRDWVKPPVGYKQKDLIGIPWMVAFALRQDGWYLRSDIIWSKPNPMPESVIDRPTKAHEYLFLLSKSRKYFYDAEAISEPVTWDDSRLHDPEWQPPRLERDQIGSPSRGGGPLNKRSGNKERKPASARGVPVDGNLNGTNGAVAGSVPWEGFNRNKRTVWTVTTQPYPEAHFATYPPDLIKPCILAGCPVGGTVLDPFAGSGTTGMVALELGRKAILIELNPNYVKLIHQRCSITPGLALK